MKRIKSFSSSELRQEDDGEAMAKIGSLKKEVGSEREIANLPQIESIGTKEAEVWTRVCSYSMNSLCNLHVYAQQSP